MKLPSFLRGMPTVSQQEFLANLKSVRFLIMSGILALVVVGGAYGISGISGGFGGPSPLAVHAHPAWGPAGEHIAVVWAADPFGNPLANRPTTFAERLPNGEENVLGETRTDVNGFARFDAGTRQMIDVTVRSGTATFDTRIRWDEPPPSRNFIWTARIEDLDGDNRIDDVAIHVLTIRGDPTPARIFRNGTEVAVADQYGFALIELPLGMSNVTIEVAGEQDSAEFQIVELPDTGPLAQGPDFVLLIVAIAFVYLVAPIFAIVIAFDAISKERVQGTLDLLLSRPVSRTGVLLGKFLGAFAAVALPVTLVNLAGIGAISVATGKAPTGTFAAAFLGLALLLIALYVLLQLTLSTLAKTSGTAILFGVLVWLLFNILYNVVVFVVAAVLVPDPEAQFHFLQVAGLGNPSAVYQQLISLAAPEGLGGGFGGVALEPIAPASAAVAWFVLLFALAVWTFHRKAAE